MKAVVFESYGGPEVLKLTEIEKPVPKPDEVCIRVCATSVTAGDWRMRKGQPFVAKIYNGLPKPKRVTVLGFELSGVVEEVGADVRNYRSGDPVFAFNGFGFGGYAEYRCLPADGKAGVNKGFVAPKPENMSFEEAAVVPYGALLASKQLRNAGIQAGWNVLVVGASGSVGTFAVQLCKYFGAEVTGLCSARNFELVRSLGADTVIDYSGDESGHEARSYDLVYDAADKGSASKSRRLLKKGGVFRSIVASEKLQIEDLFFLKDLIESGSMRSVVDRCYPLDQIVEAHEYVDSGMKAGTVAITVAGE